jgi:uncharacterized protein (DUF1810 family)
MAGRLDRFKTAQASPHAGFETALAEIKAGRKTSHWIWYVFPQLAGLGTSHLSQMFAIADADEAAEYLRDTELRSRLVTITTAVAEQLRSGDLALASLMGSAIDAQKLVSSLTLFESAASTLHETEGDEAHSAMAAVAGEVLAVAASQGYPRCAHTREHLQ